MNDIEELAGSLARVPRGTATAAPASAGQVVPRLSRSRQQERDAYVEHERDAHESSTEAVSARVPGLAQVYVRTWGCGHNRSDSEYMSGLLAEAGYAVTQDWTSADAVVLNSCTVKGPSQASFEAQVRRAKGDGKAVVVSGCVPQGQPTLGTLDDVSVVGTQQFGRIVEVMEATLRGNQVRLLSRRRRDLPALDLPKMRRNAWIEVIPINVGCLNHCTYCKTKAARGNLSSYPIDAIVQRVRDVVAEGVREIRLTSEDTGAYGIDLGTNVVQLLQAVVKELPPGVMLRLGMTNPPYIREHIEGIAAILCHPNVYAFLHIPVQSGSDIVLDAMKREYTVADFRRTVNVLRRHVPEITIATDIIVAFPGETEKDFEGTMSLVREFSFPVLNISRFYPRPGTPAAAMKQIDGGTSKSRSRRLTRLFETFRPYEHLVGTTQRVWITEVAHDKVHLAGHTKAYVQVLVPPSQAKLGTNVLMRITHASRWSLRGEVIPGSASSLDGNTPPGRSPRSRAVVRKRVVAGARRQAEPQQLQQAPPAANTNIKGNPTWFTIGALIMIVLLAMTALAWVWS